jgi:serine racemase
VNIGAALQGRLGDLTWPIVSDLIDGVVVVSEEEIIAAMKLVFERMKVRGKQ